MLELAELARRRKQTLEHEEFLLLWEAAADLVPTDVLDALIEHNLAEISATCAGRGAAFCWSGGKDSLVLQDLCELAGIAPGVMVITDLEYPEFLQWATDHMPVGLTVIKRDRIDLEWLAGNPAMLFPQTAAAASRWFALNQHAGQRRFYQQEPDVEVLVVGRRRADGNFIAGDNGVYSSRGATYYAPIRDWNHAEVFAYIQRRELPLPPFYSWPRGFRVGTGPWPARQWCRDERHGWEEIYAIDPGVVHEAAARLPGAASFLEEAGA